MYDAKPKLLQRQKAHRAGSLRTLSVDVTSACNMDCPHCYASTFSGAGLVDLGDLERAFHEAYALGVHHYILQGGEPVVDQRRLESILKLAFPEESYINVVSNGWEMTRSTIRWLKSLHVDKIAFSLDSGLEDEHDARRRKGAFRRVVEAIDAVREEGLLTSISCVVTRGSLGSEGFQRVLDIAKGKRIRLDVQVAMPVGKWDGQKDILISPEEAGAIKQLQTTCGKLPNGQNLINRDIYNFGGVDHCPAGVGFMAISADGQFLPCNFCQFSLGHIRDRSLAEMREDLMQAPWFRGSHPRCLLGEDLEFVDRYVVPFVDRPKPLDAYELFDLQPSSRRR